MNGSNYNHPDFDRPVNYTGVVLSGSADDQVASTIAMMRRYAIEDSQRPEIVQVLNNALTVQQMNSKDGGFDPVKAIYAETQRRMYFQRDEQTGGAFGNDVTEVLVRPIDVVLLSEKNKVPGDCDCQSMFIASLLLAAGIPCAFVTVAANASVPGAFTHVYVAAFPGSEQRTALDASHGRWAGWEVQGVSRLKEWPLVSTEQGAGNALSVLMLLLLVGGIWMLKSGGGTD